MRKIKNNSGITLIALIVMIVVLIIISGVSIATLTGSNGIIDNAESAKSKTELNAVGEKIDMAILKAEQLYRNPSKDQIENMIKNEVSEEVIISVDFTKDEINTTKGVIKGKLADYK